jgi:hypothetical protein
VIRSDNIGERWPTPLDLSHKSTVSRELEADCWMEGLLAPEIRGGIYRV